MTNPVERRVMRDLIDEGFIPVDQPFPINEPLLNAFIRLYALHNGHRTNGKFKYVHARKLAGLSFIKHQLRMGIPPSQFAEGLVYVISNPAWPGYAKVGMSVDLNRRIITYQTGDPHRAYQLESYEFVTDRKDMERRILSKFSVDLNQSEWVLTDDWRCITRFIREFIKQDAVAYITNFREQTI